MTKEEFYQDFLAIRSMNSSVPKKVRMLSEMLSGYEDNWQVIGITESALKVFAQHNFKKVSKMGINRSHMVDRHKTYTEMLTGPLLDCNSWWQFFLDNDKTILATSSENISGNMSKVYSIDPALGMFKAKGFAWRHSKIEQTFLRDLLV